MSGPIMEQQAYVRACAEGNPHPPKARVPDLLRPFCVSSLLINAGLGGQLPDVT